MSDSRLIVALDHAHADAALSAANELDPDACRVKVANTLFVRTGPVLIERLHRLGFEIFLDLKFHDIPMQVAGACRSAADMGVWMMNVHAAGGPAMMAAAAEAVSGYAARPRLIAVTVLTSLDGRDLNDIGLAGPAPAAVGRLARLARDSGLDGIVCSPRELNAWRSALAAPFLMVTPGIRPEPGAGQSAPSDDQKRVTTAAAARAAGADYVVVGRPITGASRPMDVVSALNREIAGVSS